MRINERNRVLSFEIRFGDLIIRDELRINLDFERILFSELIRRAEIKTNIKARTAALLRSKDPRYKFEMDLVKVSTPKSETAPKSLNTYSATKREPAATEFLICGKVTFQKLCQLFKPKVWATSYCDQSTLRSADSVAKETYGVVDKTSMKTAAQNPLNAGYRDIQLNVKT
jgi:hypothetical protein